MANRPSRLLVSIPKASADGRFYGRYPNGDAFPQGTQFQTPGAAAQVVVGGQLTTGIRIRGTAIEQTVATALLMAQARFKGQPASSVSLAGALTTQSGIARKYYPGHVCALLPFQTIQAGGAQGNDSGPFSYQAGSDATGVITITGDYSTGSIPGGHTGNVTFGGSPLVRNTNSPCPFVSGNSGPLACKTVIMGYAWSELEPTQDNYNLTRVDADLAMCVALGANLLVLINERSFTPGAAGNIAPGAPGTYLNRLPYVIQFTASGGGWQMSRWNSLVRQRFALLVQKIGNRFDKCPNFYGVATQETATGLANNNGPGGGYTGSDQDLTSYNADDYLAGLKDEITAILTYCPRSRPFGFHNFIPIDHAGKGGNSYANAYMLWLCANGACGGGPDLLPDGNLNPGVYDDWTNVAAQAHPANGPTFIAAQTHSLTTQVGGSGNSFNGGVERTPQEEFDWATSNAVLANPALGGGKIQGLFCDHIFWNFQTSGKYTWAGDIVPMMKARPVFNTWTP